MWQLVCLLAACAAWGVDAQSVFWATSGGGDWTNASNWEGGVLPRDGDRAVVLGDVANGLVFAEAGSSVAFEDLSLRGGAQVEWRGPTVTVSGGGASNSVFVSGGSTLTGSVGAGSTMVTDLIFIGELSSGNVDLDVPSPGFVTGRMNVGFVRFNFANGEPSTQASVRIGGDLTAGPTTIGVLRVAEMKVIEASLEVTGDTSFTGDLVVGGTIDQCEQLLKASASFGGNVDMGGARSFLGQVDSAGGDECGPSTHEVSVNIAGDWRGNSRVEIGTSPTGDDSVMNEDAVSVVAVTVGGSVTSSNGQMIIATPDLFGFSRLFITASLTVAGDVVGVAFLQVASMPCAQGGIGACHGALVVEGAVDSTGIVSPSPRMEIGSSEINSNAHFFVGQGIKGFLQLILSASGTLEMGTPASATALTPLQTQDILLFGGKLLLHVASPDNYAQLNCSRLFLIFPSKIVLLLDQDAPNGDYSIDVLNADAGTTVQLGSAPDLEMSVKFAGTDDEFFVTITDFEGANTIVANGLTVTITPNADLGTLNVAFTLSRFNCAAFSNKKKKCKKQPPCFFDANASPKCQNRPI